MLMTPSLYIYRYFSSTFRCNSKFWKKEAYKKMEESIRRKQQQRMEQMKKLEEKLFQDKSFDKDVDQMIIKMESEELLCKLREGDVSSTMVLKAFQRKALEVTKKTNCITEFIPEAEAWAEACDRIPTGKRGILHGLPVSIKENIDIKGMDSTMGLAKHLYNPASSHAAIVQVLMKNGAVPFCKTNVPQTLLSFCCTNPIYGMTTNPHDSSRTPGGSSGGEGVLIAAGGSILGIGSDQAGSGRVPSAFTGCCGLKPSQYRLSSDGFKKGKPGMMGICSGTAVMGRDMGVISTCMKVLTTDTLSSTLDSQLVPLPWNEAIFGKKQMLTFGYYEDQDVFPCTPGVKRAVREAKLALEKAGHTVVPFELVDGSFETFEDLMALVTADGGATVKKHIKNEIIDPSLKSALSISFTFNFMRSLVKYLAGLYSKKLAVAIQGKYITTAKLWEGMDKRDNYIKRLSKKMNEMNIDLLLTPCYPFPAPQHYTTQDMPHACFYSSLFNYCDFPSGVVPVTKETVEDQELLEVEYQEYEPHERRAKQATRGAIGLPIAVQISGARYQEELVCRGLVELEKALKQNAEETNVEYSQSTLSDIELTKAEPLLQLQHAVS